MTRLDLVALSIAASMLSACASAATAGPTSAGGSAAASPAGALPTAASSAPAGSPTTARCDPSADRAAIRRMAGTFRVSFAFDETESLSPGYTPHAPYRAHATEVVELVEDGPRHVVLQHVLVVGKEGGQTAQKHWRQDWTFEDRDLLEFRGNRTWEHHAISADVAACTWTQAVFEVDDQPRYESFGRWSHDGSSSTWVSQETWRPLPRREYTKRKDYDVLVATNRHVVQAGGWAHEQDNVKLVLEGRRALVRERGENRYERIDGPAAALASEYLRRTGPFWAAVRTEWQSVVAAHRRFVIDAEQDGAPLYERLFPLAEASAGAPAATWWPQARALLRSYVRPTGEGSGRGTVAVRR